MAREFGLNSDMVISNPGWTLPINDLPPEILSHVFQIVQHLAGWPEDWEDEPNLAISWIRITWICRHWRDARTRTKSRRSLEVPGGACSDRQ
ncbi:hypothetical protein C8Q80DRAFT_1189596 [Daedaleopsis nitida]|nr:hypothetical protein C8Q80DRAFT_1189596 [Daedaleopsis nitida]